MTTTLARYASLLLALTIALLTSPVRATDENVAAGPKPSSEEQQAYDELIKRNVSVQPLAANLNWRVVNFRAAPKPGSETLALLKPCTLIVELDLSNATLAPEDLANLKGLKNLKILRLPNSTVTDAGLVHLKDLEQLESLNLFNTAVTDAGLVHLQGLKNLKRLYVFESKVTDAGVKSLEQALPKVKIENGSKLIPVAAKPEETKSAAAAAKPEEKKTDAPKTEEKKPDPKKVEERKPEEKKAA